MNRKRWVKIKRFVSTIMISILVLLEGVTGEPVGASAVSSTSREEIEKALYNYEYYVLANDDVAQAFNADPDKMYEHWINYGMAEGRNASMVFNAKYYLEVNPDVAAIVGNDYVAAYEHFVNTGLYSGRESSPVFSVRYYLQANQDVANAFQNDYVLAAKHFNERAIEEGRSGSGNFDYTVYREINRDVETLYGENVEGYYIHYINHGRAEGRIAGLATGGVVGIDTNAVSYRIFDAEFYLQNYPELRQTVGTEKNALYQYWLEEGISLGQTASPVIIPAEYMALNSDVAQAFCGDAASAIRHFLNNGIEEGRTGSYAFDYTIYAYCNTDVAGVFGEDKASYYAHYVQNGIDEGRTAQPESFEVTLTDKEGRTYQLAFENGQNTKQSCYAVDGTLLSSAKIKYNENGTKKKVMFYDAKDEYSGDISFLYYENGGVEQYSALVKETVQYAVMVDGIYEFFEMEKDFHKDIMFSVTGLLVEEREYGTNGIPKIWNTYGEYGIEMHSQIFEDGSVVNIGYTYADGVLSGTAKWEMYYHEPSQQNQCFKKTCYYADGSLWFWQEYEYNNAGQQICCHQYDENGELEFYIIQAYADCDYVEKQYYPDGKLWCVYSYVNGILMDSVRYEYDEKGDIACYFETEIVYENGMRKEDRITEYSSDGTVISIASIELDEHGRWLKQSHYGFGGVLARYTIYEYKDESSTQWYRENNYRGDGTLVSYILIGEDGSRTMYWVEE